MSSSRLSAGIMTADMLRLGSAIDLLRDAADWVHVDLMDGRFCPQLTVGPEFVKAVGRGGIPVDAHLMVDEPRRWFSELAAAETGIITVHVESTRYLHRTFMELTELSREKNILRGIAVNPGTDLAMIEPVLDLVDLVLVLGIEPGFSGQSMAANTERRLRQVRRMAEREGLNLMVGVDGGVNAKNAATVAGWGADLVVSGSAIFDGGDAKANLDRIIHALHHPTTVA